MMKPVFTKSIYEMLTPQKWEFWLNFKTLQINSQLYCNKLRFWMNNQTVIWMWKQYYLMAYLKWYITKMNALPLFQIATRLNTQNPYDTEIHYEFRDINLYMNIGISHWHIWSIDPTRMKFCLYFISILTFKHPKLIST